jgi:hypothetical protein
MAGMATVLIDGDTLHVELKGIDAFWAVHGSFQIPLANVAGAGTTNPPSFWSSLKLIGTNAGSIKMAGTFLYHGDVVFFDYSGHDEVLVIDLSGGRYKHMFVHVDAPDTPAAAAERIGAALAARPTPAP